MNQHAPATDGVFPFFATFSHEPRMEFEPESKAPEPRNYREFVEEVKRVNMHRADALGRGQAACIAYGN